MGTRITAFSDIDPLVVPLPNGTEVTTRVDRLIEDRTVPLGAIGRVIGREGDVVTVQVVGYGAVRYQRSELLPRKVGQTRYALRRDAAWTALHPCIVLEAVVGSRAWGLADEGSDTDLRGAFVLPFPWTAGMAEPPGELVSEDGSATYWEAGKAIRQALRADPNTLELLFVDGVRALDPMGEWLLEARDAFVTAEIYGSFGRYAMSQLKKLGDALRLAEHRHLVLGWVADDPSLSLDLAARRLAREVEIPSSTQADAELQAKQYLKQVASSLHDQGLIPGREFAALAGFAATQRALALPRTLQPKNAYNLIRLIGTAIAWLRGGTTELRITGPLRDQLLAIKRGETALNEVLRLAEALTPELEAARQATRLPLRPDPAVADRLLRRLREESARRWFAADGGPFGPAGSAPPILTWEASP